jgi:transposase-like protein
VCPHCGTIGDKIAKVEGKKQTHRPGLYYCNNCKGTFTVTVGTVFERSKISLSKWWMAVYLLNSSKKGFSAHRLHRTLNVTYKTAWFMMHRIREAMRTGGLGPMGGGGKVVEADETVIGKQAGAPKRRHRNKQSKNIVLTLVERGGATRSFQIDGMAISDVMPIIRENVARETGMNTDEGKHYYDLSKEIDRHDTVNHSHDEHARRTADPDYIITTNTVEGRYSPADSSANRS